MTYPAYGAAHSAPYVVSRKETTMRDLGYPTPRLRMAAPALAIDERYERVQTVPRAAVSDADAVVVEFSGCPDSIEVQVDTFDAVVRFTNRSRDADEDITVKAGERYTMKSGRYDTVRASNRVGASVAFASVVGKWARAAATTQGAPLVTPAENETRPEGS